MARQTKVTDTKIASLMDMLASKDGILRQKARESLVTLGKPAVPSLIQAMQTSKPNQVRWEAAKALGALGDARSICAGRGSMLPTKRWHGVVLNSERFETGITVIDVLVPLERGKAVFRKSEDKNAG